jgi:uncharacterized membrane protein HdeD (DUF308 family)
VILITGLIMVGLSIAIFVNPIAAMESLIRIIGIVLVAYGAFTLVTTVRRGQPMQKSPGELLLGGVAAITGLFMSFVPDKMGALVWAILGILILITGILDVMEARDLRADNSPLAMPATISGVLTALLGILAIAVPMWSATIGMLIVAIALFVDGITEIVFGLGR